MLPDAPQWGQDILIGIPHDRAEVFLGVILSVKTAVCSSPFSI